MFRLGWDRVEFERCCLTRRRGGAEKHAENIFSGLASGLAGLRKQVKTWDRGDSGDRTASQRGSRWGGRLTNATCGGYRNAVQFNAWWGGSACLLEQVERALHFASGMLVAAAGGDFDALDRKSTRLNSSHL